MNLDNLDWTPAIAPVITDPTLPYVTHSAVLKLLDAEVVIYQLSDGQRIIPAHVLEQLFSELK